MTSAFKNFLFFASIVFLMPVSALHAFAQPSSLANNFTSEPAQLTNKFSFVPQIRPHGYSKQRSLTLYSHNGKMAIMGKDGRFTPLGQYLWDLARNSINVRSHFHYLFSSESGNWPFRSSPLYTGTVPIYQGHRLPRQLVPFTKLIQQAPGISEAEKTNLMGREWVSDVEAMFRQMINDDGLLSKGTNVATMALAFHFLRTGFESMKLHPERIYTLPKAQALVRTLFTTPYILNDEDRWLKASSKFIAKCEKINHDAHYPADAIQINGNEVFFQGGLFIGWKTTLPSLHATWDALAILNTLFSYYPEPDPSNPESIFYLWNQVPVAKKQIALKTIKSLQRKLWLDYQEHQGASYCWIVDGRVTRGSEGGPEVPQLFDHAGYSKSSYNQWAAACWGEMFGNPKRNTDNGVRALLAIADGQVLSMTEGPTNKQRRQIKLQ
jgi:hypothetical protein